MSDTSNLYRATIKALVLDREKKFLLVREDNDLWEIPGGGIDFGEKPHECLRREFMEEARLEVAHVNEQPSYFVTALNINGQWKCAVIYETTLKNLNFVPSDECRELRFFTKEEAMKQKLYPITAEFVKVYNPKNHGPKTNIT